MATPFTVQMPAPTGVTATFVGDATGGATTRRYWIQAIYPSGKSTLQSSNALATMPASLNTANQVYVQWNPMAGAMGYNVYYTTSATAPTSGSILCGSVTAPNFTDKGASNTASLQTAYVTPDGFRQARARYDFALDGGGAPGLITLSLSDTIPAGAIMYATVVNSTTAFVGATATIAVGTSAGSSASALKAATAVASYSLNAVLAGAPSFAVPVKMSADGTITITTATAALTAGVADIFVIYSLPINL